MASGVGSATSSLERAASGQSMEVLVGKLGENTKQLCSRTNVELAFIRAVRRQGSSLKCGMGRDEFLDFVVRLSEQARLNLKRSKHNLSP